MQVFISSETYQVRCLLFIVGAEPQRADQHRGLLLHLRPRARAAARHPRRGPARAQARQHSVILSQVDWKILNWINPISEGGGHIVPPPTKYRFKSGYLGARTPQTHWLFLNMYEKWYTNVFGVISLRGPPRGPTFFLAPPEKMLKSTVFELEQWFLHQNGPFFHQEFNGKGLWVLGSQFCTKKLKNISEFQNSWNFWIFGSWTQPGAWHMIVPFWSWNLSDTTHVRPHTKFQLVWAINNVFTRGGAQCAPPPHSNV